MMVTHTQFPCFTGVPPLTISTLDLFSIGVGPSSSHTVGPMRAAYDFAETHHVESGNHVHILLRGSLAATGIGHGTDRAAILGLAGFEPESTTANDGIAFGHTVPVRSTIKGPRRSISYSIEFDTDPHPFHPNSLSFQCFQSELWFDFGAPRKSLAAGQSQSDPAESDPSSQTSESMLGQPNPHATVKETVPTTIPGPQSLAVPIPQQSMLSDAAKADSHTDPSPAQHRAGKGFVDKENGNGAVTDVCTYFSVGGGFVLSEDELLTRAADGKQLGSGASTRGREGELPYPFSTADELLAQCTQHSLSIAEIMAANELSLHGDMDKVNNHLDRVWEVMQACIDRGLRTPGVLPGGLEVHRRAPQLYAYLKDTVGAQRSDPLSAMEWINLYALAVNEENAAGGQVVTAPTNGAAGIVPAVLAYAHSFLYGLGPHAHREFLLTAGAVGIIIKENASISGAEVGCQGEVGSASAMAAAGLCHLLGGLPTQVEHAAEVALEHNLGLTCDPVGGLVQIPCIERNAIGAVKSINAARLALLSTGNHRVTLDDAVKTMASTGRDMLSKYKETATGGLAVQLGTPRVGLPVNITEC